MQYMKLLSVRASAGVAPAAQAPTGLAMH